jgi:hypothetical protein
MKTPAKKLKNLQKTVDAWNSDHPVGARVSYVTDDEKYFTTTTRSCAEILSGHSAVIWLDGKSGCVLLDRVIALP